MWYFVRAPTREGVERTTAWLREIAEGAATMSQTEVTQRYYTGCHRLVSNGAICDTFRENMAELGEIEFNAEERAFAAELGETFPEGAVDDRLSEFEPPHDEAAVDSTLYATPMDAVDEGESGGGSTDVGEVSQLTPTAQFHATTWPLGTPAHSWQAVAANEDFGRTALPYVAKLLAGSTLDLLTDDERLAAAREEFEREVDGYEGPLPEGTEPPFDLTQ